MSACLNRRTFVQLAGVAAFTPGVAMTEEAKAHRPLRLWYDKPAADWGEALPIGSGRLGAMIFGRQEAELLQLNEDTLCSEEPGTGDLPLDIGPDFEHVESLLRAGDYAEASALITRKWTGRTWPCYQPMADLHVDFANSAAGTDYERELDLTDAISRVRYSSSGITYTREYFASFPDQVIVARFTASKPDVLSLRVKLSSIHPTAIVQAEGNDALTLSGQVPAFASRRTLEWIEKRGEQWKYPELWDASGKRRPFAKQVLYGDEIGGRGTRFETRLHVIAPRSAVKADGDAIAVNGAQEVVLILSAGTSYNGLSKSPSRAGLEPSIRAKADLSAAVARGFTGLLSRHVQDYQALFQRASLELDDAGESVRMPTDKRIARFSQGGDASFAALYLQFGRYLTIAASRPGTQALNLQGIWNREVIPPWASGYTTNINLEMNYWPTDTLNLSECFEPLERLIAECSVRGADVARLMYNRRGWVLHHNTTLWRGAQPVDNDAMPAFWNMGAGWLCQHLWEHYLFTRDRPFLERCYPLMRGAAEFHSDWLVEDSNGHLVTAAGCSPENTFRYRAKDGTMKRSGISMGPTMDIAITRQLFRNCVAAARELGKDAEFSEQLQRRMDRLLPYAIGKRGQLQEWAIDYEEEQQKHRHVSHLYGFYPDNQITADKPELMQAVQRSLELRGDGGTGWAMAWKICLWARLKDGNHAYRLTTNLFQPAKSLDAASEQGGLMPNMFCSCPPMQIDGNFGGPAGIVEMLLQSHEGVIHLLPALPDAWTSGRFRGFRTRAGCEVSAEWRAGKLAWAEFKSLADGSCDVIHDGRRSKITLRAGKTVRL